MRIGWVGGLTRSETLFVKTAIDAGHVLEFHTGKMRGRGSADLRNLVSRSELVVILTTINSHQAVWHAKEAARKFKRPTLVMKKCGRRGFKRVLDSLNDASLVL